MNGNTGSFVYLIEAVGTEFYKIGRTNKIAQRLKELATGSHARLRLVHAVQTGDSVRLERELHKVFRSYRAKGEWFLMAPDVVKQVTVLMSLPEKSIAKAVLPSVTAPVILASEREVRLLSLLQEKTEEVNRLQAKIDEEDHSLDFAFYPEIPLLSASHLATAMSAKLRSSEGAWVTLENLLQPFTVSDDQEYATHLLTLPGTFGGRLEVSSEPHPWTLSYRLKHGG